MTKPRWFTASKTMHPAAPAPQGADDANSAPGANGESPNLIQYAKTGTAGRIFTLNMILGGSIWVIARLHRSGIDRDGDRPV